LGILDGTPILQRLIRQEEEALGGVVAQVEEFCDGLNATPAQTYLATMAVEEMCLAIFLHTGRKGKKDVAIQITLFPIDQGLFELHIRDNAPAFDPFSLRTSRIGEAQDQDAAMDGIGVLMVKKKAKEFYYRHYQGFNTLTVRI
jgi:anti-sigma regulatory factor (Ser/Thr protein kinase)